MGISSEKTAKTFNELDPKVEKTCCKFYASETMGIAVAGFSFEDYILNGVSALKIMIRRAQSTKVAQRITKKIGQGVKKEGRCLSCGM